ncbi:Carbonyl reductase [NADPH] 3 [Echinococcus granulosus]|nr:Carbonyl reductase [NADPH] 3 [Echinococcus granulosus]
MEAVKVLEDKGLHVKFHQLDITDADSRHKLTEYIKANYPNGIDILVNNAGIAYKLYSTAPFGEQARVTIATNYTATVNMCKEFLPLMAKDSRLVNVASMMAMIAARNVEGDGGQARGRGRSSKVGFSNSAYGMSKVGLWKATAILAEHLKSDPRHILINSCCPGYVDTDMSNHNGHKTILEGADTPVYLATLPKGATEPYGQFVSERQVVDVDKKCRSEPI